MDTKSRRFSRSPVSKTVAFVLVCVLIGVITYQALSLAFMLNTQEISYAVDSVLESEYDRSHDMSRQVSSIAYIIDEILTEKGADASALQYLDDRCLYYASDGSGFEASNTDMRSPGQFADMSEYVLCSVDGELTAIYSYLRYMPTLRIGEGHTIYMTVKPEFVQQRQQMWDSVRGMIAKPAILIVVFFLTAFALVGYLMLVTGRRPGSDELHVSVIDNIYTDFQLILMGCAALACAWLLAVATDDFSFWQRSYIIVMYGAAFATSACAAALLTFSLSLVRKIKGSRLLRHSFCFAVVHLIWKIIIAGFRFIISFFDNMFFGAKFRQYPFARSLFRRQVSYIVISAVLMLIALVTMAGGAESFPFVILLCLAELVITFLYVRSCNRTYEDMEKICTQVYEIFQGNMEYDPAVTPGSQLSATSHQLKDVGSGMQRALDRQLASERMKIALVTNVSHDLKTPLTSIIGYIDLLSRDNTLSAEARDYVNILTQKSQRLKTIIEDLFDLARTTSGDASISIETLDLRRLVEQTLADMGDKIDNSGFKVRSTLAERPVYIASDGRRLYRVIQNIMDNALKYSMPGTRIFISLKVSRSSAELTFKNTAGYEMNFAAEEVLERFARGDKSRTTEGSGLGLSIAEGFTHAAGGELKLDIDGDQFTAALTFPLAPAPEAAPEAQPDGRAYTPREDIRPIPVPVNIDDPRFEPERTVDPDEIESALNDFTQPAAPGLTLEAETKQPPDAGHDFLADDAPDDKSQDIEPSKP